MSTPSSSFTTSDTTTSTSSSSIIDARIAPSSSPSVTGQRFTRKVVAITGGLGGIGIATVRRFHAEGGNVLIFDIVPFEKAQDFVNELNTLRTNSAKYFQLDVSNENEVLSLFSSPAVLEYGPIDVLVTLAAVFTYGEVHLVNDSDWTKVLGINIKGTAFCCKAVLPSMRERRSGSIVLISSITGCTPFPAFVPYSATKAALFQMTKDIALDNGYLNVRINCVAPGPIFTHGGTAAHARSEGKELQTLVDELSKDVSLRRMGTIDECAAAIAFLASSEASFITGTVLHVDGGFSRK
jgi:NAD(P)-dependent dehydrogenase (short-subunit alcohol dehydrogenase family)